MSGTKTPRLIVAAKEFNIGVKSIIEYLASKGFKKSELKPTKKLTEAMYGALQEEYQRDKFSKQKSSQIKLEKFNAIKQLETIRINSTLVHDAQTSNDSMMESNKSKNYADLNSNQKRGEIKKIKYVEAIAIIKSRPQTKSIFKSIKNIITVQNAESLYKMIAPKIPNKSHRYYFQQLYINNLKARGILSLNSELSNRLLSQIATIKKSPKSFSRRKMKQMQVKGPKAAGFHYGSFGNYYKPIYNLPRL